MGVCMGVEREPGEKERVCGGGWFIAKYLVGKFTKIPLT